MQSCNPSTALLKDRLKYHTSILEPDISLQPQKICKS